MRIPLAWWRVASLVVPCVFVAVGCSGGGAGDADSGFPDLSAKVPVGGVVTVRGKPLAEAVVTFLPNQGGSGVGETDEDGMYTLQSYGTPGMFPGEYKVAISYLVSADGEPQGLGPRSAIVQSAEMLSAKELLPDEFSNLGRTKLTASVGTEGGTFRFDIDTPLAIPAKKMTEGEEAGDSTAEGPTTLEKSPPSAPPSEEPSRPDKPIGESLTPSSALPTTGAGEGPG